MDRIVIEDLLLRCIVGINPDERTKVQDVNLRLVLHADLRRAGATDEIGDTVDYKSVKVAVREFVESSSFFLVEKLATEIARLCLRDPRVERVDVRVEKPGALRFARTVAVEISRTREDF
ncbi:MAG: dihydroneopterin aldolase [Lentisphaeria bacterium]|jgi:FolB domain-containing protein|nr:dihydroneopterin aldolase [Lentisphaeria bacterium]